MILTWHDRLVFSHEYNLLNVLFSDLFPKKRTDHESYKNLDLADLI